MRAQYPVLSLCTALTALTASCGGEDTQQSTSGPRAEPPLPSAPAQDDPAFTITKLRAWYLIGNAATPDDGSLSVDVAPPPSTEFVDLWIDGKYQGELKPSGGSRAITVDISALAPGDHEALLSSDSAKTAFARRTFTRTHPLYIVTTTDWDDADNPEINLTRQEELHAAHPDLKVTHFVGPYTFTDPLITPQRQSELVAWVQKMRDSFGDEIGLHIHPYCSFIDTTSVPCRTEPSLAQSVPDTSGYTVQLSSYTEEEFKTILDAADALFMANGLGKPTSFRAGAWSAEANTLRALASAGYVADTSAVNWAKLEEWEGLQGATLYEWNKTHWASIDATSQPYYPNQDDALSSAAPTIPILEVPDNGALVDYVTGAEMIEVLQANWKSGALEAPRQVSVGWHPPNFSKAFKLRMDELFTFADQSLFSADKGPIVYTTLSPMHLVWTHAK